MILVAVFLAFLGGAVMDFNTGAWHARDFVGLALVFTAGGIAGVATHQLRRMHALLEETHDVLRETHTRG